MSETTSLSGHEVEALAEKLDGIDGLDAADKRLLASVFAVAGLASGSASVDAAAGDDVSGFAIDSYRPGTDQLLPAVQFGIEPGALRGSFTRGFEYGGFEYGG